jgi:hypothetical protein
MRSLRVDDLLWHLGSRMRVMRRAAVSRISSHHSSARCAQYHQLLSTDRRGLIIGARRARRL